MQRTRTANPLGHFAEHFPGNNLSLLQQLLEHVRAASGAGVPHPGFHPAGGGVPHGFGPGGVVHGNPPGELQPGPFKPAQPGPFGRLGIGEFSPHGGHMPPAAILRGLGNPQAAAALWMQHHPGAMSTGQFMPSWVTPYLPGANAAPSAAAPQGY